MDRDFIERALRLARGGYADGGDTDIQSNSMPVISNGQVNWGDSDSAADFFRADAALRAMRGAQAAPEPQAALMPMPRPVQMSTARPAPLSNVPLPPPRPAYLDRPYEPEGPFGALDMSSMQPQDQAYGHESPYGALDLSAIQPTPQDQAYGHESPYGALDLSAVPVTPPAPIAPPAPTTDELLALLSSPTQSAASAAIDQAAPIAKFTDRAAPGISMTPQQRDLIIRTIAAESSGKTLEEGQGIAHVIMNRIMSGRYGKTPERVLFAPKQFEPWTDPRGSNYPMRHKPGSTKYEKAQAALDAAMGGDDITGGATLFWAPKAQAALGRPAPKWGRTGGLDIGETRFHRDDGGMVEEREGHAGGKRVVAEALDALRGGRKIFPKPQRMFPEGARPPGGEYIDAATGEAVTGQKPARAVIGVTPEGKPVFLMDQQQVDVTGSPGKGSAKTMTNLYRKSAGWEWQNAPEGYENIPMIVSTKNRGQHYYSLGADYPKGVDLARYPKETSEPRLKPTTQGNVYPGDEVGTILNKKTGDTHPVYDMVTIRNLLAGTGAAGAGAASLPDEGAAEPIEREPHAGGKAVGKAGGELIDKGMKLVSDLFKPATTEMSAEAIAAAEKAAAKKAAQDKQLGMVEQYSDAPTKRLTDWQWRPMTDVAKDLDLQEIPPHVQAFGDYMRGMSDKAAKEGLSARDLIKGYTTTRASIQRRSQDADRLRALGLDLPPDITTIRPEGAWSEWLMTPAGKQYLDEAVKGSVSENSANSAMRIMQPFGKQNEVPAFMNWAATNLPGREQAASDLVARAAQGGSSPQEWRNFTADIRGVGPSKSGFLASLYGRGDQPTLDARQIKMNTGNPSKEASKYIARGYGEGGVEAVDRLAARQGALGLEAPSQYDPFYQHLAHHSIWDKAANEVNTHGDIIRAMQEADGGAVVERALHLARGGYATPGFVDGQSSEEYSDGARPLTIYRGERPDAAAGAMDTRGPTSHARYQATLGQLGRSDDVPPMDPAVMGENWANAVRNFKVPDYATYEPNEPRRDPAREQFASPRAKSGREWIYDTIVGSPENSTIQNNRANIAGLLAGSGGTGVGALDFAPGIGQYLNASDIAQSLGEGDYVGAGVSGAMMAAAPFAGKLIKPAVNLGRKAVDLAKSVSDDTLNYLVPRAMGTAGAAGILAPGDAEAAKLPGAKTVAQKLMKQTVPAPVERKLTLADVRREFDPRAGENMSPDEIDRLVSAYGRVASPASQDPELVALGRKIAQGYITKTGTEAGGRSFFRQKATVPIEDLGRVNRPIPISEELAVNPQKSWEDVYRERRGSPMVSLGGDLSDFARIAGYGPKNDMYATGYPTDIHAGFKYMLAPNQHTIWSNAPEHAAFLDKQVKQLQSAVKHDRPIMGVAAPMGPQSLDSSQNMLDLVLSAIAGRGIHTAHLDKVAKDLRTGEFGANAKEKLKFQKLLADFPGFHDPDKARKFLISNPDVVGKTRGSIVKALERKDYRDLGFPEIGQLRYAATDPQFAFAPGNMVGGRMVEIDPSLFHSANLQKLFDHLTYPGSTFGRPYADVPLVHRQYAAPEATDAYMAKYFQERPGTKKSDPPKPPITVHPFSTDNSGRDTWRKMFEEQRAMQPINERMIDSIRLGEQNRSKYGFEDGGSVVDHALMLLSKQGR